MCRNHDAAMDSIRPALIRSFCGLPILELYGMDALNAEVGADVARRVAKYHAKLAPAPPSALRAAPPRSKLSPIEALACGSGGRSFERERSRGQEPFECPTCRCAE